jgi:hypothetical protein
MKAALFLSFIAMLVLSSGEASALITVCASGCDANSVVVGLSIAAANEEVRIIDSGYYNEVVNIGSNKFLTSNSSVRPTIWSSIGNGNPATTYEMLISGSNSVVSNVRIVNNNSYSSPFSSGMSIGSGTNNTIENTVIENLNWYAVYVGSPNRLNFRNNTVTGQTGRWGVNNGGTTAGFTQQNSNISNNVFNAGSDSTFFLFGDNNTISGNTIHCGSYNSNCMNMTGFSRNNSIYNNTFDASDIGSETYILQIYGAGADNKVFNNLFNISSTTAFYARGIALQYTNSTQIYNNQLYIRSFWWANSLFLVGMSLTQSHYNNISSNNIYMSGYGNQNGLLSSLEAMDIYSSSNNIYSDNVIVTNGTGNDRGIYMSSSNNSVFRNNSIFTNSSGDSQALIIDYSTNNTFYDSVINATMANDVYVGNGDGTTYLVNVTMNESDIGFSSPDTAGKVYVQYYLDVRATDNSAAPIDGITIYGNDSSSAENYDNPTSNFSATTNSSGYIPQQTLTQFMANGTYNLGNYLQFNNYTIVARGEMLFASSQLRLTQNSFVNLAVASFASIFFKGTDSYGIMAGDAGDVVYGYVNSQSTSSPVSSGWSHVAMTFDSGTIKLYVNGQLVDTANTSATPEANSRSILIGNGTDLLIDEVTFRSGALSASQIEQHYRVGPGIKTAIQAVGSGSLGRTFNVFATMQDGSSFSGEAITPQNLLAGTFQTAVLNNVTGTPRTVRVVEESCNAIAEAVPDQFTGSYC